MGFKSLRRSKCLHKLIKNMYLSVSPQGGDNRVEYIDSLAQGSMRKFAFCVSPDGKKIAFSRPVTDDYNEIFIRHLETGEETRLTNDKSIIDEVEWADNGLIFYTSNRSGYFKVWEISETGGKTTQLTHGTDQDYGISISTVANRLVCSQRRNVGTLWMINTDGTGNRQVYPDENIMESHIAPDGNTFVLTVSHPTLNSTLMLREINGGHQEFLFPFDSTLGQEYAQWSPDGKYLSYVEYRRGSRQRNAKVLDLAGGRRIHDLGEGVVGGWASDSIVYIWRNSSDDPDRPKYSSERTLNLNTMKESVFFRDTIPAMNILENTAILYFIDDKYRLLQMSEYRKDPLTQGDVILDKGEILRGQSWPSYSWLYYRSAQTGALWGLNYRTLKRSKILDVPSSTDIYPGQPDYNDKVVIYSKQRLKTNIVRIDNLFVE